jgi:soluble lytic murein transglycosylase-like protein
MTLRHVFTLAFVLAVAGACDLAPIAEPAEPQEQPEAMEAAALAAELAAELQPGSSICRAFRAQLLELQAQLGEEPGDVRLRTAGATLEDIITHTCD